MSLRSLKAVNGNEAVELIKENEYDLILSDVEMPECSGIEMIEKILKWNPVFDVPIVFLSSQSDLKVVLNAIDLGVRNYLLKPVDDKQIKEKVVPLLIQGLTKQTPEAIKEQAGEHAYLKHIFQLVDQMILILDTDMNITRSNPAFHNRTGLTQRKLSGLNFAESFVPKEFASRLSKTEVVQEGDFQVKLDKRGYATVHLSLVPYKDAENKVMGYIVLLKEDEVQSEAA
jgi:PAS domain S-box-containing protein